MEQHIIVMGDMNCKICDLIHKKIKQPKMNWKKYMGELKQKSKMRGKWNNT